MGPLGLCYCHRRGSGLYGVSKRTDLLGGLEPRWWLLFGEWVAVSAFALSWLTKGLEVDTLRRTGPLSRLLHVIQAEARVSGPKKRNRGAQAKPLLISTFSALKGRRRAP